MREKYNGCVKTYPNGQMLPERLCKNKNKEVLKYKKSKTKFKQKEDFKNVKANKNNRCLFN